MLQFNIRLAVIVMAHAVSQFARVATLPESSKALDVNRKNLKGKQRKFINLPTSLQMQYL